MPQSFRIGRIAGIEVAVHWSWLFIFFLVTASFASLFDHFYPEWAPALQWAAGALVSAVFFVSILLHELSHSLVAKARGLGVRDITLFVFGGVSNLTQEAESPSQEFQIAIVGPLTSLALGLAFTGLWAALLPFSRGGAGVAAQLAIINGALALFNMVPGFPLDGGRVLRSIMWWRNRDRLRATRTASWAGEVVAYLLMAAGVIEVLLTGNWIGGVWLIFIGFFLRNAATATYEQLLVETTLRGIRASAVARTDLDWVDPDLSLQQLVDGHVLAHHQRCFPVMENGGLEGLICLADVRGVPREDWPLVPVRRRMTTLDRLRTVSPDENLARVLQIMGEADVNQVPVMDGRRLLGIISRGDIMRLIQVRSELESAKRRTSDAASEEERRISGSRPGGHSVAP